MVEGVLDGDALWGSSSSSTSTGAGPRKRWFIDDLHEDSATWVLYSNWGINTETTLDALLEVAPGMPSYATEGEQD
jgi:hypothetical protein